MVRKRARALALMLGLVGCGLDGSAARPDTSPYLSELERAEAAAHARPPAYADFEVALHFDPSDGYVEDGVLWVYAYRQQRQLGVQLAGPEGAVMLERRGPLGTRRCASWASAGAGKSVCVGEHEPGGLRGFGQAAPQFALPARGGYVDLALDETRQRLWVLDVVAARVHAVARDGRLLGGFDVPPTTARIGMLGHDHLWVLGNAAPRLSVYALARGAAEVPEAVARTEASSAASDASGAQETLASVVLAEARTAPLRDASYDAARELLWLVGPEDQRVRRAKGPVEHLGSVVWALDARALRDGRVRVVVERALAPLGLCDATRVLAMRDGVWVSATGSDQALWLHGPLDALVADTLPAGLAPAGAVAIPGGVAALSRLDDRLRLHSVRPQHGDLQLRSTRVLDPRPRDTLADLGERLFYGAHLWRQRPEARFTCNSCHWDGGTDHRMQPGFREKRWELTRPLGGVAALRPIFTPGQASSLALAVEGLMRTLDERAWEATPGPRHWDYPVELPLTEGGTRRLSALQVRQALLEFLLRLRAEPGHLRGAHDAEIDAQRAAGGASFLRDCARCHEPVEDLHARRRVADADLPARIEAQPLVFGAAAFAEVGAGPSFTRAGNRISPLLNLSRGGPYFASGEVNSLDELLRRFVPGGGVRCHGGDAAAPAYDAEQRAALEVFLRSL